MLTIVGISGRLVDPATGRHVGTSRVGKDTVALALQLYYKFIPIGLADDMTSILYRLGGRDGDLFKRISDFRAEKCLFGTEARTRAGVPGVWRDVCKATIAYLHASHGVDRVVVPDIRYDEEVDDLRSLAIRLGGRFVHLEVTRQAPLGHVRSTHSSELPLRRVPDDSINNDGDIRDLVEAADNFGHAAINGGYDRAVAADAAATVHDWEEA